MTVIAILLALLINLVFTCALIAGLYYLAIYPLNKRLESERKLSQNRLPEMQGVVSSVRRPDNFLPDMDDLPIEAFYGDEEPLDYTTRPEDLEEALTQRAHNTYNSSQKDAFQQLKGLNPDAA